MVQKMGPKQVENSMVSLMMMISQIKIIIIIIIKREDWGTHWHLATI
jgi:hypothetical protein